MNNSVHNLESVYGFPIDYFRNCLDVGELTFFGEKFYSICSMYRHTEGFEDSYDIVLQGREAVWIISYGWTTIKFKSYKNDIPRLLRKVVTFRCKDDTYKNHRIYLGIIATGKFCLEFEKECIENGIALIKQDGDTPVVHFENLKVF